MNQWLVAGKRFLATRGGIILQAGIVSTWVVMLGFLVVRTFGDVQNLRVIPSLAKEGMKTGEDWWGIYYQQEKIGYGVTLQQQHGAKVSVKERVFLKLSVLGTPQNIVQTLEYQTNQNLTLDSFDFSLESGFIRFHMAGSLEDRPVGPGKRLKVKIHSGGKERQQEILLPEAPYIIGQTKLYFLAQGLEKGRKYRIATFDPSTLGQAEMIAEAEGTERLNIGGEEKELYRVREEFR